MRRVGVRQRDPRKTDRFVAWVARGVSAVAVVGLIAGCNGNGGGGGGNGGGGPAATPTRALGANQRTESNSYGSTTLDLGRTEVAVGDAVQFIIELRSPSGSPLAGQRVNLVTGAGLVVRSPAGGSGQTDAGGRLEGVLDAVSGGVFAVQAVPVPSDPSKPLPSATLNVAVFGATQATPTPTLSSSAPTQTPTGVPVVDVAGLIVQVDPFSITSAQGGDVAVTVRAFDSDNLPVPGVRLLLDVVPRVGTSFSPQTPTTNADGIATSVLHIQPGVAVGTLRVSALAGDARGEVPLTVVSGAGEQPVAAVQSIIVDAQPSTISSALGGTLQIAVTAFDAVNVGVSGVRLLMDAEPRVGTSFSPQTPTTDANGRAFSTLSIQPGAAVGNLTIFAEAGTIQGSIAVSVVSGISQRPVATIVLESDQPVIGSDSGGTASLKARVLDADNIGIPDVNVLFQTAVGEVNPAVAVSCGGASNPCPPADVGLAQSTLIVPPNAIIKEYELKATAGGQNGSTSFFIVPGRGGTGTGNPNAAEGEPAGITLGASPTTIQVQGTGGTDLSTVIARLFDNNNNPLAGRTIALRVVPDRPDGAHMLPLSGTSPAPPAKCLEDPGRAQAFAAGRMALGVSDRAGFVLAAVRAGTVSGTVTIEACADSLNLDGATVTALVEKQPVVTVAAGAPAQVTLTVNPKFVDNNDGTLVTTLAALVKDAHGNTVEDGTAVFFEITNRPDVSIFGSSSTNEDPPCDTDQFPAQTGVPVTAQPGTAITCMFYPIGQAGTVVRIVAESGGVTNEDNEIQDEEFGLPPAGQGGPASGVPSAHRFNLASVVLNLSGQLHSGLTTTITAFVADRAGNPISRQTLVRFATDGGSITSQSVTNLVGRATATLSTQAPVPADGRVTVTASVRGEEDYIDIDEDNHYDPDVDIFDPVQHDQDNDGEWSADTEIRTQLPLLFTGFTQVQVEEIGGDGGRFEVGPGEAVCFAVHVSDALNNPIVGGSFVTSRASDNLKVLGPETFTVVDTSRPCGFASSACDFQFCVAQQGQLTKEEAAAFSVIVTSGELPGGASGNVARTLLGRAKP